MQTINTLVRKHTAFNGMLDLLKAKGGYRPSLMCADRPHHRHLMKRDRDEIETEKNELAAIADFYDALQIRRGDSRRAYRF